MCVFLCVFWYHSKKKKVVNSWELRKQSVGLCVEDLFFVWIFLGRYLFFDDGTRHTLFTFDEIPTL